MIEGLAPVRSLREQPKLYVTRWPLSFQGGRVVQYLPPSNSEQVRLLSLLAYRDPNPNWIELRIWPSEQSRF